MRLAALRRVQQQHLSSPLAGTKPCSSAKRLQTQQKDGYDTDTDVRDSLEIQEVEKEHDEARKLRHSRTRRRDKFIKL